MAMNTNTANIFISASDKTKQAFDSINGSLAKVGGAIAAVIATAGGLELINTSLKKFADLQDFGDEFDMAIDKALLYVDTLKLAGIEQGEVQKSFEDLSEKVSQGLTDHDLANAFKQLNIDAKELKNLSVDKLFDKIKDSLGKMEDKTKGIALSKKIFGDAGTKIFAASQDEELQAIEDKLKSMTDEIRATSIGADEFYKNLDRIKMLVQNDVATSFASVLIPVNAILDTIIKSGTEVSKIKTKADILAGADSWMTVINNLIDMGNIIYNVILKGLEAVSGAVQFIESTFKGVIAIVELVGKSIYYGITEAFYGAQRAATDVFEALALAAKGNFEEAGEALKNAITPGEGLARYAEEVTKPLEKISEEAQKAREGLGKIFSVNIDTKSAEDFKNKLAESYKKAKNNAIDAMNKEGGGGKPKDPVIKPDVMGDLQHAIKLMEKEAEEVKYYNSLKGKYNELAYTDQIKSLEDYYKDKSKLAKNDYETNKKLYDDELAKMYLAKGKINPLTNKAESRQLEEQIADIKLKQIKNEKDYAYAVAETNSKELKDRFDKFEKEVDYQKKLLSLKEDEINFDVENGRNSFEANSKIVDLRKEHLAVLREEIVELEKQAKLKPKDNSIKLELEKAKLNLKKFEKDIDPIAKQINETINSGFETFFNDVVTGTKSVKDAFLDMGKSIEKMILQMIAKNLGNKLMENLFPSTSNSGGDSGILSSLLSGGGGDLLGSLLNFGGARATGGPVSAGSNYLVGERGPEVVHIGQSGYVTNARDTARASGGGSPNVYITVNAKDADSFRASQGQIVSQIRNQLSSTRNS